MDSLTSGLLVESYPLGADALSELLKSDSSVDAPVTESIVEDRFGISLSPPRAVHEVSSHPVVSPYRPPSHHQNAASVVAQSTPSSASPYRPPCRPQHAGPAATPGEIPLPEVLSAPIVHHLGASLPYRTCPNRSQRKYTPAASLTSSLSNCTTDK